MGLHLAAMIARDARTEPWAVSGDDRYVGDYLHRETFARVDPGMQAFLRRTAVLDRFTGPLCDAVLGESGAQERLRALEASNSFLVPLDRTREWYRYHPLFRDFLLGELRRTEPDQIEKLRVRAADWFLANGSPSMAVEYLLSTAERERSARLVARAGAGDLQRGADLHGPALAGGAGRLRDQGATRRWRSWPAGSPPWSATRPTRSGGRPSSTRSSFDEVPEGGPASFASSRAMLRAMTCPAGPEQLMADAELAVAQETPSSQWRDTALYSLAEAHLLAGDVDRAVAAFEEATSVGQALGHTDPIVSCTSELAILAMDAGRWEEAADLLAIALGIIDDHQMHDYAISVLAFAAAARLAVHRGDLVRADRRLTQGMRSRPLSTFVVPFLAVRGRLQLAKVYTIRGDQAAARMLLREIDDILKQRPLLGALVDEVAEFRRVASGAAAARHGGLAADLRRAAAPAVPADLPHDRRDRGPAASHPQHGRHRGVRHLPQAGCLLAWRRRSSGHRARASRRLSPPTPGRLVPRWADTVSLRSG